MLTKTSLNILKILVSKGIFEDVYDGANIIISLIPYPSVIQVYLQSIDVSNIIFSSNSTSVQVKPVKVEAKPEPQILQVKSDITSISQSESAKQAILDLDI